MAIADKFGMLVNLQLYPVSFLSPYYYRHFNVSVLHHLTFKCHVPNVKEKLGYGFRVTQIE